jgi:uncharacterized protein DUF6851/vanadium-dependent haloperoxidase-like protein
VKSSVLCGRAIEYSIITIKKPLFCLLVASIATSFAGCGGGGGGGLTPYALQQTQTSAGVRRAGNVVVYWDQVTLQSIRTEHLGPTVVARTLAMVHTAIYDAWATYDERAAASLYHGSRRPLRERTPAHENEAISYAAYRTLLDLFPSDASAYAADMSQLGFDPIDLSTDSTKPDGIGNGVAAAVLAFRHHDGANQLGDLHSGSYSDYTGYAPVNTPQTIADANRWQPLLIPSSDGKFTEQVYTTPFWGLVKPFALSSGSQLRPGPPAKYPSPSYVTQTQQILDYSANLDDTKKVIAEYWRDGPHSETPPGHWCLFAQYVSARDHHKTDDDAKMFFALTNALLDASIAIWDAKRAYDSERPITAVHWLFAGRPVRAWAGPYKGTREIDGSQWVPYQPADIVTPPFAEYVSGHSGFSAAAAQILKSYTGSDYFGDSAVFLAGTSTVEAGAVPASSVTLSWNTFTDAAVQAGLSRRYGGIHFEEGDLRGRVIGRAVGEIVWNKALALFSGTSRR